MLTIVDVFQDYGTAPLIPSSMNHQAHVYFVTNHVQMVVYDLAQITVSVMILNVLAVVILLQIQTVYLVDSLPALLKEALPHAIVNLASRVTQQMVRSTIIVVQ
jgi:hypothetical protein